MKRAMSALAATVAGLALLVSYKPTPVNVSAGPSPSPSADTGAGSASADTGAGSGSAAATATPAPTPAPGAAATGGAARVVTGPTESMIFGDVQVQLTVSGKRIVDVKELQMPFDRARSAYISQYVGPILRQEAIQAQSANIDLISGATYTSVAFDRSLAAALHQAPAY